MAKFAKLIELENEEQVLLSVEYNEEDDDYDLSVRTDLDGFMARLTFGFAIEEAALEMMRGYTLEKAKTFRVEMEQMVSV